MPVLFHNYEIFHILPDLLQHAPVCSDVVHVQSLLVFALHAQFSPPSLGNGGCKQGKVWQQLLSKPAQLLLCSDGRGGVVAGSEQAVHRQ